MGAHGVRERSTWGGWSAAGVEATRETTGSLGWEAERVRRLVGWLVLRCHLLPPTLILSWWQREKKRKGKSDLSSVSRVICHVFCFVTVMTGNGFVSLA